MRRASHFLPAITSEESNQLAAGDSWQCVGHQCLSTQTNWKAMGMYVRLIINR